MSETFCPIPWNHMGINHNGDLRQCCQMIQSPYGQFITDGVTVKFDPATIDDTRNHESVKSLRKEMMEGKKPSMCTLCWREEAVGVHSKRMHMLNEYAMEPMLKHTKEDGSIDTKELPLSYLDLRFGNLCNLKCRSCDPSSSSLWVDDHVKLTGDTKMQYYSNEVYEIVKKGRTWKIDSNDFDWHDDDAFHSWIDAQIKNLNRIYFAGGEPTISKTHLRILKRIIEIDKAANIILDYNTNFVAVPPSLMLLWRRFKRVHLGISVDAIGPLAHYVRHPSNWKVIEKNCDQIGYGQIPNLRAGFATTISVLNIRHFLDLSKWSVEKFYTNVSKYPSWHLLHSPTYLSIQVLPEKTKAIIEVEFEHFYHWVEMNFGKREGDGVRKNYNPIIKFMKARSTIHELKNLKMITAKLDAIRNEKLEDNLPWLADILKHY